MEPIHTERYFRHYLRLMEHPLPEIQQYFDAEKSYLEKLVGPESTVLDVGCGSGRNTKDLAPLVTSVTAIDIDERMINAAVTNLAGYENITLLNEDFFLFPNTPVFDLTLATYNTLGSPMIHAFKRPAFLERMVQCTRPGGHVVTSFWKAEKEAMHFSFTYFKAMGVNVLEREENRVVTDAGVFKRFTVEDIEELAKPFGKKYSIVELTPIFRLLDITV